MNKTLTSLLPVSAILAIMLSSCDTPLPPVQRPFVLGAPLSVTDTGDSDLRFVDAEAGAYIQSGYNYTYPYSRHTDYYYGGSLDNGGHYHNGTYHPNSYFYQNTTTTQSSTVAPRAYTK